MSLWHSLAKWLYETILQIYSIWEVFNSLIWAYFLSHCKSTGKFGWILRPQGYNVHPIVRYVLTETASLFKCSNPQASTKSSLGAYVYVCTGFRGNTCNKPLDLSPHLLAYDKPRRTSYVPTFFPEQESKEYSNSDALHLQKHQEFQLNSNENFIFWCFFKCGWVRQDTAWETY